MNQLIRGLIVSPLHIKINRKGDKWYLNLNKYRNTHYQSLNTYKVIYKKEIADQIEALPVFNRVRITFSIYAGDARLFDIGNIRSVHEKFFCDAFVELGKIPEDNYKHIPETHTYFVELDRKNPRVEIFIEEILE